MSNSNNEQSIAGKAFDETVEVIKLKRNPIDAAQNVKRHAEKLERKEKKSWINFVIFLR